MMKNVRLGRRVPEGVRHAEGQTAYERLINSYLEKIQKELKPEQARLVVAINIQTGQYALGEDSNEALTNFRNRWPDSGFHLCRVDGSPSGRI